MRLPVQVMAQPNFGLRWLLATGLALSFAALALPWALTQVGNTYYIALILIGVVEGALLGITQSTVLGSLVPTNRWITVTIISSLIAWALVALAARTPAPSIPESISGIPRIMPVVTLWAVHGALIGFAQWFVLRKIVDRALWWIPAGAVAWMLGEATAFNSLIQIQQQGAPVASLIMPRILTALLITIVTGLVMVKLQHNDQVRTNHGLS
ncbi:MAG: hypothetical protein IT324_00260 [Anaerolineae bacterium]|nr:hypothetical protein [Anaerolineae bacterium]